MNPKSNSQKKRDRLRELEKKTPICCGTRTALFFIGMDDNNPLAYYCEECGKTYDLPKN